MKKTLLYVVGGFFALGILAVMCDSEETSKDASEDSIAVESKDAGKEKSSQDPTAAESEDAEKEKESSSKKSWKVLTSKDEMRGSVDSIAYIESDNEVEFEFPYNGGATLRIAVRKSQRFGTNVYLSISDGQFIGNAFDGSNYVTIKFEDGPLQKYYFDDAADGSTDVIFLRKEKELIAKFKTAKKIMIEAPFFDSGSKQFTFTVGKPLE